MKIILIKSKKYGKKEVFVDDDIYDAVSIHKWFVVKRCQTFYAGRWVKRKCVLMHRFIMNLTERNELCDHADHNGLNNQRDNLRKCNFTQNCSNNTSSRSGSSKYLGVSWDKKRSKWAANLTTNRKKLFLGRYENEVDAALAYNTAAIKIHGNFSNPNNIDGNRMSINLKATKYIRKVKHSVAGDKIIIHPLKENFTSHSVNNF